MSLALPRLLQLASATLPVGAYSYSQGLEWAVEAGWVHDAASVEAWIVDLLDGTVGRYEAPLYASLHRAWLLLDGAEIARLNTLFIASRESAELRAETLQMGYSLRQLIFEWEISEAKNSAPLQWLRHGPTDIAYPTVWSAAAALWKIDCAEALIAYLWSWCENQTMAALKLASLGQKAGQRLLLALGASLPSIVDRALTLPESQWSNFSPALAIASCQHETQYSRLFRS